MYYVILIFSFSSPKDAVRAIRKRLQQNAGKNYTVVMYTLIVSILNTEEH